jgi:hypothetical protein
VLGSVASAINMQHGWGENDVSAYEAVYGQKTDHEFSCSKEEAHQCWTVLERLKVTNNPELKKYACKNYIICDAKICDDDANGYFSDRSLPVVEKEEVSDEYFFDHLNDDISGEDHGESKRHHTFDKFNAESDNHSVDPVRNVVAESRVVSLSRVLWHDCQRSK